MSGNCCGARCANLAKRLAYVCKGPQLTILGQSSVSRSFTVACSVLLASAVDSTVCSTELTRGCRVLHYSGHGEHDCLWFEDCYGGCVSALNKSFRLHATHECKGYSHCPSPKLTICALIFARLHRRVKRMTADDLKTLALVRKRQLKLVIISACNSRKTAQV